MKCPHCETRMIEGSAEVRSSLASIFFAGVSFQNLYFDSDDISREVLESREGRDAHLCLKCRSLVVKGNRVEAENQDPAGWEGADPWGEETER